MIEERKRARACSESERDTDLIRKIDIEIKESQNHS